MVTIGLSLAYTSRSTRTSASQCSMIFSYAARSPLQHADRIRCPVVFFQGLEDVVVPPEQTERMAEALRANGIPVEVHLFAEEGHGFRSSSTQITVLEASEAFFRHHFSL